MAEQGWSAEDYRRIGMVPPAELVERDRARRATRARQPERAVVAEAQPRSVAEMMRGTLARRLAESGAE